MVRILIFLIGFWGVVGTVFSQSIEKGKVKLPFSHPGINRVRTYEVTHADIPKTFEGFRIAFISDLHYKSKFGEKGLASLVRMLRALQPDLLLMGGDYQEGCEYVDELFDSIATVKAPYGIVGVMGNNDYERCHDTIISTMKRNGIHVLEHEIFPVKRGDSEIFIAGVRNPFDLHRNGNSPVQALDSSAYVILLTHTPDYAEDTDNSRADLALAGHTHGGQVTFLGLYAPIVPSHYGRRFRTGLKETTQGVPLIITNGIGTSQRKIRFCAPSEIVLLELHSLKKNGEKGK